MNRLDRATERFLDFALNRLVWWLLIAIAAGVLVLFVVALIRLPSTNPSAYGSVVLLALLSTAVIGVLFVLIRAIRNEGAPPHRR